LEGASHLAAMARAYSGCEVWQQDFLKLDLPDNYFDGVFANALLFHVPSQELPRVLPELRGCLKPGGVFFSSNPRGHNQEGWSDGRYDAYHELETWRRFVSSAGFTELTHYYRPAGLPLKRQPWLASIWRRQPRRLMSAFGWEGGHKMGGAVVRLPVRLRWRCWGFTYLR
jgi:SAM-dependent methyltransferase